MSCEMALRRKVESHVQAFSVTFVASDGEGRTPGGLGDDLASKSAASARLGIPVMRTLPECKDATKN